jgi:hypothetical protein
MKALEQITQLLGLLSLIHGFEFLSLSRVWSDRGVWRWQNLSKEITPAFAIFLSQNSFYYLNIIRIATAVGAILVPNPWCLGILFFIHVLTVMRWLGSFNGGSDYMSSLLFLFTFIGVLFTDSMGAVCLWYITLQLCLSYFKAGWIKLIKPKWRRGEAISSFVLSPIYAQNRLMSLVFKSKPLAFIVSWSVMLFELLFPLALLDRRFALGFIAVGILFHLGNAFVFGLNRFVFAWLAAYPALYWCATALTA